MTLIGPPSRPADELGPGMSWCSCGLHQHPARIGHYVLRPATGCPICKPGDYTDRAAQKPTQHVVTWLTDDSQRIPREEAS